MKGDARTRQNWLVFRWLEWRVYGAATRQRRELEADDDVVGRPNDENLISSRPTFNLDRE